MCQALQLFGVRMMLAVGSKDRMTGLCNIFTTLESHVGVDILQPVLWLLHLGQFFKILCAALSLSEQEPGIYSWPSSFFARRWHRPVSYPGLGEALRSSDLKIASRSLKLGACRGFLKLCQTRWFFLRQFVKIYFIPFQVLLR